MVWHGPKPKVSPPLYRYNGTQTLRQKHHAAVTIATRYLHARKQFSDGPGQPERQVITYPSVYMRILPILARSYSFIVLGDEVQRIYHEMLSKLKTGNADLLAE